jgi:outer membrane protein OmpA-like peptidoglycan-associated protein
MRRRRHTIPLLLLGACAALPVAAPAQDSGPLYDGGYLAPMATYVIPGAKKLDDGFGGTLALGVRRGSWALELFGYQVGLDADGASPDLKGGGVNGLLFPFASLPNLYGIATLGGAEISEYPLDNGDDDHFTLIRTGAGAGYLFPLSFGSYDLALRAEALYVLGHRDDEASSDFPVDAPKSFDDVVINLGLQLPLGLRQPAAAPVAEPVAVVPPVAICADGQDNDGDGQIDFPADPGCSAADDGDETDPPACADGKDNDSDGLIDFPNDKGCSAADDTDETDPCKTPQPGERISLKGCGTGDVIVLRGVNFEFDKARLTANAKTILDNVAEELAAYPDIKVELSGHTDAKGSDEYNQRLSDKRAAAVKQYLVGKDIAADRMSTVGYGESKPVADNETDEGREQNRRTELRVTEGVAGAAPPAAAAEAPAADAPAAEAPAADAAPEAAPAP